MTIKAPAKTVPAAILKPRGLCCPVCESTRLAVIYTTLPTAGTRIRYRRCLKCQAKVKTREVIIKTCP